MKHKSWTVLKEHFRDFYSKNPVDPPPQIACREFGVGTYESKIKFRHKSFPTNRELSNYLRREAPFYISYSTAYYEFPENQPMSAKNWQGADLVFDLDVDMGLLDSNAMEKVKQETLHLIDFLLDDFGFSKNDLETNFSGSKGYHIKVFDEDVRTLSGDQRREIVDYVTGTGLDINAFMDVESLSGFTSGRTGQYVNSASMIVGPKKGDSGWPGRIYDVTRRFLLSDPEELVKINGIGPKRADQIYCSRDQNIRSLERGMWSEGFTDLVSRMVPQVIEESAVKLTEDTDKMVTIDTSRLIRLPGTLHGGSGFVAKKVTNMESFNPLVDAIAFGEGDIKIDLAEKIKPFDLNEQKFSYPPGTAVVPEYVGVYLILKGLAEVA